MFGNQLRVFRDVRTCIPLGVETGIKKGVVDGRTCGGDRRRRLDEVTARPGHDLSLFSYDAHMAAFRAAAPEVTHDLVGLLGRGLYIGVRPVAADYTGGRCT